MSKVSARSPRSSAAMLRRLALMASASLVSLMMAGEAHAQCSASPAQPITNVTMNNTSVDCAGVNNGTSIVANADNVLVSIRLFGTQYNNGTVNTTGNGNTVSIGQSASTLNTAVTMQGNASAFQVNDGVSNNLSVSINGADSTLRIGSGAIVTATQGAFIVGSPTGSGSLFSLGGQIYAASNASGAYLVTGQSGAQTFELLAGSTLSVQADGRAINGGAGDDVFLIEDGAFITGGTNNNILFDGGNDNDSMSIYGSGISSFNTVNIETLTIDAGTGGFRGLNGTHADLSQINIVSGSVNVQNFAALGLANSSIDLATDAMLVLSQTSAGAFNHSLTGSGALVLNAGATPISFGGTSTGFAGTFLINTGNTAIIVNDAAFGSGVIANGGTVQFGGGLTLGNAVSGNGVVIKTGAGSSTLTGMNSYSGGTLVQDGALAISHGGAVGSGAVDIAAGATFNLAYVADGSFGNTLTGGGMLLKSGNATVTLTGTANHMGGTFISAGALRVDDLVRLGAGGAQSNGGASLILDYAGAGQMLVASPFFTGGGTFIKDGSGDVVISAANGYTGGTIIRAGRLGLNNGNALGSGYIEVDAGAILGIGNIVLSNALTGAGSVIKTASGTAELYGNNSAFTGLLDVQQGELYAIAGEALGGGTLNIAGGADVTFGNSADTIVVADITGSGNFTMAGSGRLILTGDATAFGGGFAVQNGILQVAGDQNLGTSAGGVFINTAGTLQLDTATGTTLASTLYGSGRVVKTGSGTVFVTGANSYSGGTDIHGGALRVTDIAALGSGAINVAAGAALDLSIAGAATLNQSIAGAGILRKSDAGDLTLLSNALTGGVDIVGGRVIIASPLALGGGPVTTATGTQLVVNNAATEVMSTLISGDGSLLKDGAGLLVIQNANSFTGGTLVASGRLGLNNGLGLGTGGVVVQQGAILGLGGVTVANAISGGGQVIKTASNVGALTGVNSYSGGTDIQGGTLVVNSPAALGTGGVSIGAGTALAVDYSGQTNVALNNALGGGGMLVKDGSGTLVMNAAANSYSGGTLINAGQLNLNFSDALGSGGVTINAGAALGIGSLSIGNAISGGGVVRKLGANSGTLTGTNSYSGGTEILGGTLLVGSSANLGSGTVSIASGAELIVNNAATSSFTNATTGAGTLRKTGAGQLSFANPFTVGSLLVDAGRVRINTVATTNATVAANAALDGTGRIIGTLTNNGLVAPGNSIGTLNVQGNYVHNAGSVLEIEFDGAGNIDLLAVTGNATLNGGTLRFVSTGGAEGNGGTFLTTGGSLTGTFTTVETVGALLPLAVIYQPNAAIMAPSVLTARPSTFNAQQLAATDSALSFIGTLGFSGARRGTGNRLWMEGFGSWADRSASGTTLAYAHNSRGLAGGVEVDAGSNLTIGAAIGWSDADIRLGANGGGGDQSAVTGALYARYAGEGFSLGGGLAYGGVDQATVRNVSFNGFSATVNGDTNATVLALYAGGEARLGEAAGWTFGGALRGAWVRHDQDGYTEDGSSPLRLSVAALKTDAVEAETRLTASRWLWNGEEMAEDARNGVRLDVGLGARVMSLDGDRTIPVTFAASNAGITLDGDGRDGVYGLGEIGLTYVARSGLQASLGYRADLGETDRHSVRAGLSIRF